MHSPATGGSAAEGGGAAPAPCTHLLMSQGEHLLHAGDPGAGEALAVLAHSDGFQPLGHRPEHGAVAAAGAGQADGDSEEQRPSLVSHNLLGGGKRHRRTPVVFLIGSVVNFPVPWIKVGDGFQRLGTPQQLVQKVDDVCEAGSFGAVVLPALKHELIDGGGAVHWSGEPERLVDGLHNLRRRNEDLKWLQ